MLNRLDHIAFRVSDYKSVVMRYVKQLGYQVVQEMELEIDGSRAISRVLKLPGTSFYVFVDQGMEKKSIISQWVQKHGSGLHHMAYLVDDIFPAWEKLKQNGLSFTTDDVIDTGGGLKQLFTHPDPDTGLITEIIERERDGIFFVQENVKLLIRSTKGL